MFRIIRGGAKHLPKQNLVLSKKAQLYLMYSSDQNIDYLNQMMQLRDAYLYARDYQAINRITAAEIENVIRNGLTLATRQNIHKEKNESIRDRASV